MIALLAFSFFIGFIIESIVGFGGTLIAYSFLLFFFEIKPLIISTIILPIIASIVILFSDAKNISWKLKQLAKGHRKCKIRNANVRKIRLNKTIKISH